MPYHHRLALNNYDATVYDSFKMPEFSQGLLSCILICRINYEIPQPIEF
jgi:hypothetical protein